MNETPDFSKLDGLVPVIIQHAVKRNVLMLGFMNQEAYKKTIETGLVTFFSRSRNRLWTKGEESGHYLKVVKIYHDCDNDTLLILADPAGPTCHTGQESCFGDITTGTLEFLNELQAIIHSRHEQMPQNSYTTKLFREGVNRIAQKVGEEAVELVIEAKDSNQELFLNEAADLVYHLMVLLEFKQTSLKDVAEVLRKRHKEKAG